MFVFLLVLHLIVAIALVTIILMQRSEGGGLTGASPTGLVSARGAADLMTRLTTIFATLFVILSIALAAYAAIERGPRKIDASLAKPATSSAPTVPVAGGNQAGTLDLNSLTPAATPAPTPVPIGGGTQNSTNTAAPVAADKKEDKPAEQPKAATKQTPPPTAAVKERSKPTPQAAPTKAAEKAPTPPAEAPKATTNVPTGLIPETGAPK
jgi:preprotein translocase subunit SecG